MNDVEPTSAWSQRLIDPKFIRWFVMFIIGGCVLYLSGMVWSGWALVIHAFTELGAIALLAGAFIASLTYLVRFGRWHLALYWLGSKVPWLANLKIYLAGMAFTTSPGKLGETFRSVLLAPLGVPAARSLGAFLADRLSDVLGVCFLGAVVGWWHTGLPNSAALALLVIACGSFAFRFVVLRPPLWERWTALLPRYAQRPGKLATDALQQWARLWHPLTVVLFSYAAAIAYGIQAGVFAWFCRQLGMGLSNAVAIEIFVNATLLGAASLVPGGLGAMEAALVVQLAEHGIETGVAVSVAMATRLVTLWTGILIGICSLLTVTSRQPVPRK
ncbi:MAG: flippase-like domain-containing protein [Glaciimonas sp.]|nr:flippase-like domain-containing protein [Glaciimonas sp.]